MRVRINWTFLALVFVAALAYLGYKSGWLNPPRTASTLPTGPLQAPPPAPSDNSVATILVSVNEIKPYTMLNDIRRFKYVKFPVNKLREGLEDTITSFDQLKGKTSRHYVLKPDEPIYLNDVAEPTASDRANQEVMYTLRLSRREKPPFEIIKGDRLKLIASVPRDSTKTDFEKYTMDNIEVLNVNRETIDDANYNILLLLRVTDAQSFILKFSQRLGKLEISKN